MYFISIIPISDTEVRFSSSAAAAPDQPSRLRTSACQSRARRSRSWLAAACLLAAPMAGPAQAQPAASPATAQSPAAADSVASATIVFSGLVTLKSALPPPPGLAEGVGRNLPTWLSPARFLVSRQCAAGDVDCLRKVRVSTPLGFALKVDLERTAKEKYFITVTLASMQNAAQLEPQTLPVDVSDRQGSDKIIATLTEQIGKTAADLLSRMVKPPPREAQAAPRPAPPSISTLTVTVEGTGSVQSQTEGLDCGIRCTARFREPQVTLLARPGIGRGVRQWRGTCGPASQVFPPTQWPCTLALRAGAENRLGVRFGYTPRRQAIAGVFGILAGASLVTSAVLLGLQGMPAGEMTVDGQTGSYNYNTGRYGLIGLGLTVGFGLGLALPLIIPEKRGN